jgi:glycosyltransferase involved in cell wall biosynthesis
VSKLDEWRERTGLEYRDGYAQWRHVESDLVGRGADTRKPIVSVIVPTFQRDQFLVEAIESVLAQDWDQPFELVIVDNDPQSCRLERLLEQVPALAGANYSYYVHRENMGWIGNFNRGMELARASWLTILNDDDLLDADFLRRSYADLASDATIDGLASRKRFFNDGPGLEDRTIPPVRRAANSLLNWYRFGNRPTRRIIPSKFFWNPLLGNMVGFIFKKSIALDIGGFYQEDWPSDCWFYVRFAALFDLRQGRDILVSVRVAENMSLNPKVARANLKDGHLLRQALTRHQMPSWYMRLAPLITARHMVEQVQVWGTDVPKHEVEEMLSITVPRDRPVMARMARFLLNGF